jgi:hypothetical protein
MNPTLNGAPVGEGAVLAPEALAAGVLAPLLADLELDEHPATTSATVARMLTTIARRRRRPIIRLDLTRYSLIQGDGRRAPDLVQKATCDAAHSESCASCPTGKCYEVVPLYIRHELWRSVARKIGYARLNRPSLAGQLCRIKRPM